MRKNANGVERLIRQGENQKREGQLSWHMREKANKNETGGHKTTNTNKTDVFFSPRPFEVVLVIWMEWLHLFPPCIKIHLTLPLVIEITWHQVCNNCVVTFEKLNACCCWFSFNSWRQWSVKPWLVYWEKKNELPVHELDKTLQTVLGKPKSLNSCQLRF